MTLAFVNGDELGTVAVLIALQIAGLVLLPFVALFLFHKLQKTAKDRSVVTDISIAGVEKNLKFGLGNLLIIAGFILVYFRMMIPSFALFTLGFVYLLDSRRKLSIREGRNVAIWITIRRAAYVCFLIAILSSISLVITEPTPDPCSNENISSETKNYECTVHDILFYGTQEESDETSWLFGTIFVTTSLYLSAVSYYIG